MKKLAVLLLMGLTVFSLSACGSEPVEEATEVTKEVEEVEEVVEENVSEEPVETEVEEVVEEPEEDGVKITNISVDDPNGDGAVHPLLGGYATHLWAGTDPDSNTITYYDVEGNELSQCTLEYDGESDSWGCWYYGAGDEIYILAYGMKECETPNTYAILDGNGKVARTISSDEGFYYVVIDTDGTPIFVIQNADGCAYISAETGEDLGFKDSYIGFSKEPSSSDEWSVYVESRNTDYYFASNGEDWAFLDKDMYELARYNDVTDFNKEGYALASDDRETYYVIDTDFNVVKEDVAKGNSAAYQIAGDYFYVSTGEEEDRNFTFITVE